MKLLGSTKNMITKDGNDEKVPHIEFTEVVLFHGNNPIMIISTKNAIFLKTIQSFHILKHGLLLKTLNL